MNAAMRSSTRLRYTIGLVLLCAVAITGSVPGAVRADGPYFIATLAGGIGTDDTQYFSDDTISITSPENLARFPMAKPDGFCGPNGCNTAIDITVSGDIDPSSISIQVQPAEQEVTTLGPYDNGPTQNVRVTPCVPRRKDCGWSSDTVVEVPGGLYYENKIFVSGYLKVSGEPASATFTIRSYALPGLM